MFTSTKVFYIGQHQNWINVQASEWNKSLRVLKMCRRQNYSICNLLVQTETEFSFTVRSTYPVCIYTVNCRLHSQFPFQCAILKLPDPWIWSQNIEGKHRTHYLSPLTCTSPFPMHRKQEPLISSIPSQHPRRKKKDIVQSLLTLNLAPRYKTKYWVFC